jgi:hypothetical protein
VCAGLALLACSTLLAPFSLSPSLSCIASFTPVILFVMARFITWASRQFSRWRRRKPPRQRRASTPCHTCNASCLFCNAFCSVGLHFCLQHTLSTICRIFCTDPCPFMHHHCIHHFCSIVMNRSKRSPTRITHSHFHLAPSIPCASRLRLYRDLHEPSCNHNTNPACTRLGPRHGF